MYRRFRNEVGTMVKTEKQKLLNGCPRHSLPKKEPIVKDGDIEETAWFKAKLTLVKLAGYFSAILSSSLIGISTGCAQVLGGFVPDFEFKLWRFAAQVCVSAPVLIIQKQHIRITTHQLPYMFIICVAYNVFNWAYFGAAPLLPMGIIGCLGPTILLVETAFVQAILTKQCRIHVAVAVFTCLVGAVFLTQPDFIFGDSSSDYTTHSVCIEDRYDVHEETELYTLVNGSGFEYNVTNSTNITTLRQPETDYVRGYIYMIIAASAHAVVVFTIKAGLSTVNPFVIIFWVGVTGFIVSFIGMFIFETVVMPCSAICIAMLLGHSFSASLGYVFQTIAVVAISPLMYALMVTLQIVFMVIGQYTVLDKVDAGHRNVMEVCGATAVLIGNVIGPFYRMYEEANGIAPPEEDSKCCTDPQEAIELQEGINSRHGDDTTR